MRAGATSHNAIAAKLNERNVRTARGGVWTHVQVGAILHPLYRHVRCWPKLKGKVVLVVGTDPAFQR